MAKRNPYVLDPEDPREMARLTRQGRHFTQAMAANFRESAGLFPPVVMGPNGLDPSIKRLLDVGCGPADWVHSVAVKFPSVDVVGIDISQLMIQYAIAQTENREITNATFQVMDALVHPMDFPDGHFDLVNVRTAGGFVASDLWPGFVQECSRLLKPLGWLVVTEGENGVTTYHNPATRQAFTRIAQVLHARGYNFGDGQSTMLALTPMLREFFTLAQFEQIDQFGHVLDASYGSPQYKPWLYHTHITMKAMEPLIVRVLKVPQERFDEVSEHLLEEVERETYHTHSFLVTVVGRKPIQ